MPWKKGKPAWNSGLKKETDSRVAKYSKTLSEKEFSEEHKRNISLAKQNISDETKQKISNGAKRRFENSSERLKASESAKKRFENPEQRKIMSDARKSGVVRTWNKGTIGLQKSWSKGLTKETNLSVAEVSRKLTGRTASEEARHNMSIAQKKLGATSDRRNKLKLVHNSEEVKHKHTVATARMHTKRTWIERKLEELIDKIGAESHPQYVMKFTVIDNFVNLKIPVYVDGCYWHGCEKHFPNKNQNRRIHDIEVFNKLKELGYHPVQIWEHEFKEDIASVEARLRELCSKC